MTRFLRNAAAALRRRIETNRTMTTLSRLTDSQLRDIGLSRYDIGRVARS